MEDVEGYRVSGAAGPRLSLAEAVEEFERLRCIERRRAGTDMAS